MVGGGPSHEEMKEYFRGTPTVFPGYLRGDELVAAYRSADAFIFPSTTETFGLVALEAMACRVPVIAARSGGVVDTVMDGVNGFFFDPAQPCADGRVGDALARSTGRCARRWRRMPCNMRAAVRGGRRWINWSSITARRGVWPIVARGAAVVAGGYLNSHSQPQIGLNDARVLQQFMRVATDGDLACFHDIGAVSNL